MGAFHCVKAIWRETVRLIILTLRIQAVLISYILTSIVGVVHGKEAVVGTDEFGAEEDGKPFRNDYHLGEINEFSDDASERQVYVSAAVAALDEFWSKAEDKVREMAGRRISTETKMKLEDGIQESYVKFKHKLEEDLKEKGLRMDDELGSELSAKDGRLEELKALYWKDCRPMTEVQERKKQFSVPTLDKELELLDKMNRSASVGVSDRVYDMLPVLKDVQKEVTEMLKYLEGYRHCFDPQTLKDLSVEYQHA